MNGLNSEEKVILCSELGYESSFGTSGPSLLGTWNVLFAKFN